MFFFFKKKNPKVLFYSRLLCIRVSKQRLTAVSLERLRCQILRLVIRFGIGEQRLRLLAEEWRRSDVCIMSIIMICV